MSGSGDFRKLLSVAVLVLGTVLGAPGAAADPALTTLYSFGASSGDGNPRGALAFDRLGALYGTTQLGEPGPGGGTVFKLTPQADPSAPWTKKIIFPAGAVSGAPYGGVIFDENGVLYGTARFGGRAGCTYGCGMVFQASPQNAIFSWTTLWSFAGTPDGGEPVELFLDDSTGVLYGTTAFGGLPSSNCQGGYCGTVFTLKPRVPKRKGPGPWTYSVIWRFTGGDDGGLPGGPLVRDASGALYGTTLTGGARGKGTVFQLTPGPSGYSLKTIWSVTGAAGPIGSLTFNSGRLFGTAMDRVAFPGGGVFELSPPATPDGAWGWRLLWSFTGHADGFLPNGGLVFDKAGNLYGTTRFGGTFAPCSMDFGCGTVFKGIPPSTPDGSWAVAPLWKFTGAADGGNPSGPVIFDAAGTALYGTTQGGGADLRGTVFKLTP